MTTAGNLLNPVELVKHTTYVGTFCPPALEETLYRVGC